MTVLWSLAAFALAAWIYLLVGRGFYWRIAPRLTTSDRAAGGRKPRVAVIIPARDEADILSTTLPTVLGQAYDGEFTVTLVDDRSEDETAAVARRAAQAAGAADQLTVLRGTALPEGWSGKVWALAQGIGRADAPDYYWFTDADIAHEPWVLQALVDRAEREPADLVSVMALLRVDSFWDRLLIPAFVYFFAKLYPFGLVNDVRRRAAGAAGGCVLVRHTALARAGGLSAMRSALIDDCTLGRLVKRSGGRLWLSFSSGVRSVRPYGSLASTWNMVARSAYDQLAYSPLLLAGTVVGMSILYLLPPLACAGGLAAATQGVQSAPLLAGLAGAAWALMTATFVPTLRHQRVGTAFALLLPAAAGLYTAMTISSAWRYARGRGGAWKGRTYGDGEASATPS